MFDEILILDAETRWASKPVAWAPEAYTLSKMTTEEYIRSPLFKAFGFGFKKYGEEGAAIYLQHSFLPKFFASIDWSRTAVCAHNAQFDIAILTWVYGIKPAFIFDTLSMARALYGIDVGNSAKKLAERFNLPPKGFATQSSDGLLELPLEVERELADYCKHDVFLCEKFLDNMLPGFPKKELKLIDATIRMFTEPQLALDKDLLQEAIDDDREKRASLLGRLGVTEEQLASNDKFALALQAVGVEAPTKISPTTNKEAFAFAKNDALFQQILNGDNEDAVLLCEARMTVKSTQERTRAQRFLDIAGRADGLLPVPVNYAHTRTLRWGACLVAETKILVYDHSSGVCEKKIVDILPDDLVWDGVEFVQHGGVQFSGYQEVITHDGITGTPEHEVFLSETESCRLDEAARRSARIMDAREPDARAVDVARAICKRNGWRVES